jgi:GNAT superfamily N-acetyltransferase
MGEGEMQIVDLEKTSEPLYFKCLEEWSDEMKESGSSKEMWYRMMQEKGLRVKLALDDAGTIGGMIQYAPIEHAPVLGKDLYFVYCIWVHGYKQGRGNFQKKGMGKTLLRAAEEDARALGAKGMAAWGVAIPVWMRASWFKKQGYHKADSQSMMVLLWKPFTEQAEPPMFLREKKLPEPEPGKVTITALLHGWCPASNIVYERAKRAAAEFGDQVVLRTIPVQDKATIEAWGQSDAVFVNNKQLRSGPPLSYEKIHKRIARQVKKLKK